MADKPTKGLILSDGIDVAVALAPAVLIPLAAVGLPLVGLAAVHGLLGGTIGFLATAISGERQARKLRELQDAVDSALKLLVFRVDTLEENLEEVSTGHGSGSLYRALVARIDELAARLDRDKVEDLAEIIEQLARTADEEWLAFLRQAAVNTVLAPSPDPTRHTVLRRLRDLTPAHIAHLRELKTHGKVDSGWGRQVNLRTGNNDAIYSALGGAGFIDVQPNQFGQSPPTVRMTPLGYAVLTLLHSS
jgi:hypothetical protein